jgi:hypothetical protein
MIRIASGKLSSLTLLAALAAAPLSAAAHDDNYKFKANLDGFEEVPAISTEAHGQFKATFDPGSATITYELRYDAVSPTQSHIHFGQRSVNGGISVFLCSNLGNGPAGTQACPPGPATIGGTLQAANVIGPAGQGIASGQFDKLVEALREGVAYVNVHSVTYPGGEARGQIK